MPLTVVIGRVVHAAVTSAVSDGDPHDGGLPTVGKLRPLLGRNEWPTLGEVLDITRITHEDWPGHYREHYSPPTA
jgi:hypothetical protein